MAESHEEVRGREIRRSTLSVISGVHFGCHLFIFKLLAYFLSLTFDQKVLRLKQEILIG